MKTGTGTGKGMGAGTGTGAGSSREARTGTKRALGRCLGVNAEQQW